MAEGESKIDKHDVTSYVTPSNASPNLRDPTQMSASSSSSSRAVRWKLTRSASKSWFTKSFDQSTLSNTVLSSHPKQMRRQSSVSDFFQSMLTKSRSHLVGLFSGNGKRENTRNSMLDISDRASLGKGARMSPNYLIRGSSSEIHYPYGSKSSISSDNLNLNNDEKMRNSSPSRVSRSDMLDMKDRNPPKGRTSPADLYIVSANNELQKKTHIRKTSSPLRGGSPQSINSQTEEKPHQYSERKTDFFFSPREAAARESKTPVRSPLSTSSSITFSVVDFTEQSSDESNDEATKQDSYTYRQISSAPGGVGRQSLSTETSFLSTNEDKAIINTKRALVKSNSDTITKFSNGLTPITKASSDGNCFWGGQRNSPISASSIARITDHLFVGSVEAAYSDPILCKYKITSLIDMTNIQPRLVPLHKKSDCPCPCINKDHFRSKLNIGVDDIEWENLEQYFKEINTFIDGSRKKKGRTLIFSYMGQSRAPAAAMQYLMHHYEMSHRESFNIVVSKWPMTKLNPGFVKTLKRLEVKLSQEKDKTKPSKGSISPIRDTNVRQQGIDQGKKGSEHISEFVPPIVRGAWLEC